MLLKELRQAGRVAGGVGEGGKPRSPTAPPRLALAPISSARRRAWADVCIRASTTTQIPVRKNMMACPTTRRRHWQPTPPHSRASLKQSADLAYVPVSELVADSAHTVLRARTIRVHDLWDRSARPGKAPAQSAVPWICPRRGLCGPTSPWFSDVFCHHAILADAAARPHHLCDL